jgi:hypothetical protein
MPHLSVTAQGSLWRRAEGSPPGVETAVETLGTDEPVVILIHGYRYRPGDPASDPHRLILSRNAALGNGDLSWPYHLGIRDGAGALSIGFGWDASGTFWAAREEAGRAGLALAALIRRIRTVSPGRRVTILAHSLGARVVLSALPALEPGDIARAVLMFPALLARETHEARALRAAIGTEFIRVTSGENRAFELLVAALAAGGWTRPISSGGAAGPDGWTDLAIDCDRTLAHLAALGYPLAARSRKICHWSSYMRPGIFALYRALLTASNPLPVSALRPTPGEPDRALWDDAPDRGDFAMN